MRPDTSRFRVGRIIVHETPTRLAPTSALQLSDMESEADAELRAYFRTKIVTSLASAGTDVEFAPEAPSPCPELITELLQRPSDMFVAHSKTIAKDLHHVQHGGTSGGILIVIEGKIDDWPALALLLLEKDSAIQLQQVINQNGLKSFDMIQARNLVMSEKARVFKASIFVYEEDSGKVAGLVSDMQKGSTKTPGMAEFFRYQFLGCRYASDPLVMTKDTFETVERVIKDNVESREDQFRYINALVAEMNKFVDQFDFGKFAIENIKAEHRADILRESRAAGVPQTAFPKDTGLIVPKLAKAQILFNSDLNLSGPPSSFTRVVFEEDDEGESYVLIRDAVREYKAG